MEAKFGKRPREVEATEAVYDAADVVAVELDEKENENRQNAEKQKKQKQQEQIAYLIQLRADLHKAGQAVLDEFDRVIEKNEGAGRRSPGK